MLHRASCVNKFDQPYKKINKTKDIYCNFFLISVSCVHIFSSVFTLSFLLSFGTKAQKTFEVPELL